MIPSSGLRSSTATRSTSRSSPSSRDLGVEALAAAERDELEQCWLDATRLIVAAAGGRFRAFAPWRVTAGFAGTSVGASALVAGGPGAALLSQVEASGGVLYVHPESAGPVPQGTRTGGTGPPGTRARCNARTLPGSPGDASACRRCGSSSRCLRDAHRFTTSGSPTGASTSAMRSIEFPVRHGQLRPARDRALHRDLWRGGPRVRERHTVVDSRPTLQAVRGFGDSCRPDPSNRQSREAFRMIDLVARVSARLGTPTVSDAGDSPGDA